MRSAPGTGTLRRRGRATWSIGLAGLLALLLGIPGTAGAGELTIRLCGMKNRSGDLLVTVFSREHAAAFTDPSSRGSVAHLVESLEGRDWVPVELVLSLPAGDYAVRVIHDENRNGILDRNGWLTTPTESYGYSRNARARVSAVEFDEAAVTLGEDPMTIGIRVAPWSITGGDRSPCPE